MEEYKFMTQQELPIYPDHQWVLDILDRELKVGEIIKKRWEKLNK